jgi:TonB-linked SusC/RagA family outer membrane protein
MLFVVFLGSVQAQTRTITGKVINKETGETLAGVTILAEKSKSGTSTKKDGTYSIVVKKSVANLVFSSIGFANQIVPLDEKNELNVSMIVAVSENADVVVIGYGTQKKGNVTGSISKYKNDKLDELPVTTLDQALQGRIAGVQVQNVSSESGAAPQINIRGISSVSAASGLLVVVDGQIVEDGLAYVNMSDVESVEVLKDAASAAIYGSRGAGGVIIVTTKSGKADKPKYAFKYALGSKEAYTRYDIMSSSDYLKLLFDEAKLVATDPDGTVIVPNNSDRASYIIEQVFLGGKGTDWQSQSLKAGIFQNATLTASGGKKDMQYYISGGYQKDGGMMYKSSLERFTFRTKLDLQLSKKVRLSININPSFTKKESPSQNFTNFARFPSFLPVYHNDSTAKFVNQIPQYASIKAGDYAQPRHFASGVYRGYMPDSSYWDGGTTLINPSGSAQNNPRSIVNNSDINTIDYRLQTGADISINLAPGLVFKSLFTTYINHSTGLDWESKNAQADNTPAIGIFTNATLVKLLSENTLAYNKTFKDHSLNVVAGYTLEQTFNNRNQATGIDFPNDNIRTLNNALTIDKSRTFGTKIRTGMRSYLARVIYSYQNKYLLNASIRSDGSSFFAPGRKWASFPAVSVGWVASQEKYLQDVKWLNRLKFRASYGHSGNNRITDFAFLDLLTQANYSFGAGTGTAALGQVGSQTFIANPNITWETSIQNNFGADITLFKNKVNLTIDVYQSKTDKLLLQQSAQAFTGVPFFFNNIGSLRNRGIEIELSTTNISNKNFKWSTSLNYSANNNEIIELGQESRLLNPGERNELYQNKVGSPLVQFYGFKTDGVWLSQNQIDVERSKGLKSEISNIFIPGGLKIVDINGDNIINNYDRTVIGSPLPKFTWGITNTLSYKAFDLSFTLQGVQGGQLVNGDPNYTEIKRTNRAYNNNRWLSPMFIGDGKTPYDANGIDWLLTDYVVEDASYWSLRDINFGYKLPNSVANFAKIKSLRVYFSVQNLYFHSAASYRGLNPEGRTTSGPYASSLLAGYQRGTFPTPRTFIFGIDVNF